MKITRNVLLCSIGALALATAGCSNKTSVNSEQAKAQQKQQRKLKSVVALMRMGDQTREGGDPVAALRFYVRAARLAPGNAEIQKRLGYSLLAMHRYPAAASAFRQALATKPADADSLRGLGNALIAQDRPKVAVNFLKSAIANSAKSKIDHRSYNSLGVALDMIADHVGARQAYRLGLEQKPENVALRNNLGLSLALSGKYRQSMAVLEGVARSGGGGAARVRQNLALVYGLAGRNKMAKRTISNQYGDAEVDSNMSYYKWLRRSKGKNRGRAGSKDKLASRETARRVERREGRRVKRKAKRRVELRPNGKPRR